MGNIGSNAAFGIGAESTWGAGVARTHWYDAKSFNVREFHEIRARQDLSAGATSRLPRATYKASINAGGPVSVLAHYEGMGPILQALLGGTPATSGPASGLYTHTFGLARTLPPGLTLETVRGSGGGEVLAGGMISKGVLKVTAGDQAYWDFDVIGKSTGGRISAATPTWTTARDTVMVFNECVTVTINGITYNANSLELSIDNKLGRRAKLGTLYTAAPDSSSMMDITIKLEIDHEDDNSYAAMRANSEGDGTITLTDADGRSFSINANLCRTSDADAPINTAGLIKETVTFIPKGSASDPGLTITVINTQSTALAA